MANSGTVCATDLVVYSQYNNLRTDVLNVTTGHGHTGATEDGKQLSGAIIGGSVNWGGYALGSPGSISGTPLFSGTPTLGSIGGNPTFSGTVTLGSIGGNVAFSGTATLGSIGGNPALAGSFSAGTIQASTASFGTVSGTTLFSGTPTFNAAKIPMLIEANSTTALGTVYQNTSGFTQMHILGYQLYGTASVNALVDAASPPGTAVGQLTVIDSGTFTFPLLFIVPNNHYFMGTVTSGSAACLGGNVFTLGL